MKSKKRFEQKISSQAIDKKAPMQNVFKKNTYMKRNSRNTSTKLYKLIGIWFSDKMK